MKYLRDTKGKERTEESTRVWANATCCGHLLDPVVPMTLAEIIEAHRKYDKEFQSEGFHYSKFQIAQGLSELVNAGLVKEVQ